LSVTLDEEMEAHCLAVERAYKRLNKEAEIARDLALAKEHRDRSHLEFLHEYFTPTKWQKRKSPLHVEVAVKVPHAIGAGQFIAA
jgi:hypothetical protein